MNAIEIKKIRKSLGKTQKEFAKMLGVSNNSVQLWETEKRNPSPSMQFLINETYKKHTEGATDVRSDETLTNTNGNRFVKKEDGSYNITTKLIPFDAYASYSETLEDVTIMNEWEDVTFNVEKYGRGNYMSFRVKGDSMNGGKLYDTPNGAMVLARELNMHHWKDGFNNTKYGWIILCKLNIFHKDIIGLNSQNGTITCHSRNASPEYSDFVLELNDIYKIFKVIKRTF